MPVDDPTIIADSTNHQLILQKKINKYLAFVESGELLKHRADAALHAAGFQSRQKVFGMPR